MRGKHRLERALDDMARITPAHAGKTLLSLSALMRDADHPRACGENRYKCYEDKVPIGSPPRMRGKHSIDSAVLKLLRITPAHAGKTLLRRINALVKADHPRACGENMQCRRGRLTRRGSPPRMRGKRGWVMRRTRALRITPAHAGKTSRVLGVLREQPDHPRACGENAKDDLLFLERDGSPPRMRGKRDHDSASDID